MAKKVLALRVTDAQRSEWEARAKEAGMSLSAWVCSMCDYGVADIERAEDYVGLRGRIPVPAPLTDSDSWFKDVPYKRAHHPNCNCGACRGK